MEILDTKLTNLETAWEFQQVVMVNNRKFRIDIHRDAFDEQSWANCEWWNGETWEFMVYIPIRDCNCYNIKYFGEATKASFAKDVKKLVADSIELVNYTEIKRKE